MASAPLGFSECCYTTVQTWNDTTGANAAPIPNMFRHWQQQVTVGHTIWLSAINIFLAFHKQFIALCAISLLEDNQYHSICPLVYNRNRFRHVSSVVSLHFRHSWFPGDESYWDSHVLGWLLQIYSWCPEDKPSCQVTFPPVAGNVGSLTKKVDMINIPRT